MVQSWRLLNLDSRRYIILGEIPMNSTLHFQLERKSRLMLDTLEVMRARCATDHKRYDTIWPSLSGYVKAKPATVPCAES